MLGQGEALTLAAERYGYRWHWQKVGSIWLENDMLIQCMEMKRNPQQCSQTEVQRAGGQPVVLAPIASG